MKGKGMPAKGKVPVTAATFISAWKIRRKVMPVANIIPKASGAS